MSCLFLSESDVEYLVDIQDAVQAIEQMFIAWQADQVDNLPRGRVSAPGMKLHSMAATGEYLGRAAWKEYTTTRKGAHFYVGLHDAEDGKMLALIKANHLGRLRTGAIGAVAAKWLWRGCGDAQAAADLENTVKPERLGLIGTGWQAETLLTAINVVFPQIEATVYSRDSQRRQDFCRRMGDRLGQEVVPANSPSECVREAELVATFTTSSTPVVEDDDLSNCKLILAMGSNAVTRRELSLATVVRASQVWVDDAASARQEAGELIAAVAEGKLDWNRVRSLREMPLSDSKSACSPGSGMVVFKSVGIAAADLALASVTYDQALRQGIGHPCPWD